MACSSTFRGNELEMGTERGNLCCLEDMTWNRGTVHHSIPGMYGRSQICSVGSIRNGNDCIQNRVESKWQVQILHAKKYF